VEGQVTAGELLQRYADGVGAVSGGPVRRNECGDFGESGGVDDFVGYADAQDAPASVGDGVDLVDVEADDGVAAGGGECASARGAEQHLFLVEEIADRLDGRQGSVGEHDPADVLLRQQLETFGRGEFLGAHGRHP
jgi:hypothetical protein